MLSRLRSRHPDQSLKFILPLPLQVSVNLLDQFSQSQSIMHETVYIEQLNSDTYEFEEIFIVPNERSSIRVYVIGQMRYDRANHQTLVVIKPKPYLLRNMLVDKEGYKFLLICGLFIVIGIPAIQEKDFIGVLFLSLFCVFAMLYLLQIKQLIELQTHYNNVCTESLKKHLLFFARGLDKKWANIPPEPDF